MKLAYGALATCFALGLIQVLGAARPQQGQIWPRVEGGKNSGIYAKGEDVSWTFTATTGETAKKFHYTIKSNNFKLLKEGELDLSAGPATVEIVGGEPEMLYGELTPEGGRGAFAFGAAVEPTKLKMALPRPRDFDSFWASKIKWLHETPENPVLTPGESGLAGVDWGTIQMDHVNGTHVYGQWAKPSKPGKYPAMVVLQWASPPYPLDKNWVIWRAQQGWLVLNIEPHDVPANADPSVYANLPTSVKNYNSIGPDDREKSYFLAMYLRDYRAVDYITHRPDWNGKVLVVTGGSMGGQQSLCVAGLHPAITHVVVNEPAGCDLSGTLAGRQVGYPFFNFSDPKVAATVPYFDCVNFASRIRATSLVAMGFLDTIAPPAGIWVAFNQIRGPKQAAPMIEAPHNNIATQEQQKPYNSAAEAWLAQLVSGGKVLVKPMAR